MELIIILCVGELEIHNANKKEKEKPMLGWALTFLVIALIAGVLGFGGVAAVSVEIAQLLFVVFLVLFIVAAAVHALRGRTPPV